ncbi:MAG: endonuclease III [Candidatus Peregrinibacteria bacterium Greene0416_19]|nr:MAG: endonuclease III [Candidatus Peregrinibacteria bacterium Greene0416_19]
MKGVPIATVLRKLRRLYQPPRSFLAHRNPFELLVATILSAQCTDARVNIITKDLFRTYRTPRDFLLVPLVRIERNIRSCGHYHSKARYIRETCRLLIERFAGRVPSTMEELLALPGVGRKTASCVLHAAFDKHEGIAVDTHVIRLARRLGLTWRRDQKRIELDLMRQVPRRDWGAINPLLISHGRAVCTARNRMCDRCLFHRECPSSRTQGKNDRARM